MSDNFFGFTTASFEQFAQGLCHHVLGPGVEVFGIGPDGGREATFNGEVPFPSDAVHWNGYGVIQAKYKDKTEGTAIDQKWAMQNLEDELKLFIAGKSRKRKPEYYIFITNVVLTPVGETGGRDRAHELIESYKPKLGLRDYRIWHSYQISHYVNQYSEIRRRFGQFLAMGDVFAAAMESMEATDNAFSDLNNLARVRAIATAGFAMKS